jgi:hypothetical protein
MRDDDTPWTRRREGFRLTDREGLSWGRCKYAYRVIKGGIGHNLPQEAPQDFAQAVVELDGY